MSTTETIPRFEVKHERNDTSTLVRVQELENGFVVKTGGKPIHYKTIEAAAEAVKQGLIEAAWPSRKGRTAHTSKKETDNAR